MSYRCCNIKPIGHKVFNEYLEKLRMSGKWYFSFKEIIQSLAVSENSVKSGLYRLKKEKRIITPLKGLYIIVPPEHRPHGSIPAEELVPIIMKHLDAEYYVALLSASSYFGASHQKPARFQVISNKRIKHSLTFGQISIELIYKKSISNLPTQDFIVNTGYLKVASPELIAIDLFKYPKRSAGISHIATVLSELIEYINIDKLISLAESSDELCQLQRLGYVIEKLDAMDENKQKAIVDKLEKYLQKLNRPFVVLVPYMLKKGFSRCSKWKIIENTDFESDL